MPNIADQIKSYQQRIITAAHAAHRHPDDIGLLAVSKNQPADAIKQAFDAGIHNFGESYWQEARDKLEALQALPITWHFIGPLQTNKAKYIARHFAWVHSVCKAEVATALSKYRQGLVPPLKVCIQVNINQEATKSGVLLTENTLIPLAKHILSLPHLELCGLMAIPEKMENEHAAYQNFLILKQALDTLNQSLGTSLNTLSMGMTDDFIPAIQAGSTWIRIGRGIFNAVKL